jgi:hypothetical protein
MDVVEGQGPANASLAAPFPSAATDRRRFARLIPTILD